MPSFIPKRQVPKARLAKLWKEKHPRTPMPRTEAYVLSGRQFEKAVSTVRKSRGDTSRVEYGHNVPTGKVIACTFFEPKKKLHLILARNASARTLKHEQGHIFRGRS